MKKLSHDHVDEIARMLYQWLPSETLRAENCYAALALDVYGLLRSGQEVRRVASYLGRIRSTELGLPPDPEFDHSTAQQLVQWWGGQ